MSSRFHNEDSHEKNRAQHRVNRIDGAARGVWSFAQATPGAAVEPQGIQTAVISAQVSSRSASAPLDMRVSVQYVNSKPAGILEVLAKAAGLTVEVSSSDLRLVTLTLTNVRLRYCTRRHL